MNANRGYCSFGSKKISVNKETSAITFVKGMAKDAYTVDMGIAAVVGKSRKAKADVEYAVSIVWGIMTV